MGQLFSNAKNEAKFIEMDEKIKKLEKKISKRDAIIQIHDTCLKRQSEQLDTIQRALQLQVENNATFRGSLDILRDHATRNQNDQNNILNGMKDELKKEKDKLAIELIESVIEAPRYSSYEHPRSQSTTSTD